MNASRGGAWIDGVGLRGPGLDGWLASIDVLAGTRPHVPTPTQLAPPAALPAAERRRVGKGVKVALEVGFAAVAHAGRDPAALPSVFTSSSGDGDNCDAICRELAGDRMISPTRFHNSVHNAPSGYWGIAAHAMAPSTSLCAYDGSFVAGLDDALLQLASDDVADEAAILVVAYDAPYPEPLHAARPTPDCFAVGLVLARTRGPRSLARVELAPGGDEATTMADAALESCRRAIPAARALPLLAALATRRPSRLVLDGVNGMRWLLAVEPVAAHAVQASRLSACA